MRFDKPASVVPAHFAASYADGASPFVPLVTHEEIARGQQLRAQFCRRAARAIIVVPSLATARFIAGIVRATLVKREKRRAFHSTVRTLNAMADSQLRDIGVNRSAILHVAWTLVYTDRPSPPAKDELPATEPAFEHPHTA
ncbi:MAG: DUF1127 domain-containing protein [Gammaproteobacteria bacterium]|nr:DUF1127 domain-containing protein [Gammaproteobacteria bacterium]NIM73118.1 DUF1127 domain-containing protein [Gammaproteobacteria bacterium]NIN38798.1 DUF1127 domain-containing protein [Gammaproteobacteria bacterium]NIO24873.1 DUF1127 domain-containing protein [Gammaproteobacteria bacterium]NIO65475.1 DUF1127 domain-containing protein [Gammaproteobacteria bacterium]